MQLTIGTVVHGENNKRLFKLNVELFQKLNRNLASVTKWYAIYNTETIVHSEFQETVKVERGVLDEELADIVLSRLQTTVSNEAYARKKIQNGKGSFQHALGLQRIVDKCQSRFLLIMDNDFFVIEDDWANKIMTHMIEQNLVFLGSPWHPKYSPKYRYFPSVHFLFIDCSRINKNELNFMPSINLEIRRAPHYPLLSILPTLLRRIVMGVFFFDRMFIGKSADTGRFLYNKYAIKTVLSECLQPTFIPEQRWKGVAHLLYWLNVVVERFLPDHLCFTPKRKGYYTRRRFAEVGYPDVYGLGWEEYYWHGKPFAFHIRGTQAKVIYNNNFNKCLLHVKNIISSSTKNSQTT